jgi:hypothetical protein
MDGCDLSESAPPLFMVYFPKITKEMVCFIMNEEFKRVRDLVRSTLTAHGLRIGDIRDAAIEDSNEGFAVSFQSPVKGASKISLYFTDAMQAYLAREILKGNGADAVPVREAKRPMPDRSFDVSM